MCLDYFTGIYHVDEPARKWILHYGEVFGQAYDNGNEMGNLHVLHWSREGQYVYLAPKPAALDGPGSGYFEDGTALLRLDLISGRITQTLQPSSSSLRFYSVSFSPDSRSMAYFRTWIDHPILNLVDLVRGVEQHIELGEQYTSAGRVVWSPEGDRIVVNVNGGDVYTPLNALLLIELDDLEQKVLLKYQAIYYIPGAWREDQVIILQEMGYARYVALDVKSGEIKPYQFDP